MSELSQLYARLNRRTLSEAQLFHHGFPRPSNLPGKARVRVHPDTFWTAQPSLRKRICERCKKTYEVDSSGYPVVKEECRWHLWRAKNGIYGCCGRSTYGKTCKTSPLHVTSNIDPDNLKGFIDTSDSDVSSTSVFALDCEMVSTTRGMEIAAITVVDHQCKVVYETLVLPEGRIIDYNTIFSSLTSDKFRDVTTKLEDVHTKLMSLVGTHTILVGHGLHNDLLRLQLFHGRVVDTIYLYPHPKGLPAKNPLRFLKQRHLPHLLVNEGLKCREDAVATMMLARLKCGFTASP
ncbi:RNA exonuclease 1 [Portunus trituberculatus]|uniref:RNA exonuclease 1 n=1 Tax=Portunus trituberculatus TaxID=210409 RepID=A0A5B7I5W4_PORTR|nr:RNA exonuclease 1 [Portunus trituberculatus]